MFLSRLNSINPSFRFPIEKVGGKLPFSDVQINRQGNRLPSSGYCKPTFTGLYTWWESYAPASQKLALITSLTVCAKTNLLSPVSGGRSRSTKVNI